MFVNPQQLRFPEAIDIAGRMIISMDLSAVFSMDLSAAFSPAAVNDGTGQGSSCSEHNCNPKSDVAVIAGLRGNGIACLLTYIVATAVIFIKPLSVNCIPKNGHILFIYFQFSDIFRFPNPVHHLFPYEDTDAFHVAEILEGRCWPRNRANIDELLHACGLKEYDVMGIIRATHGCMYNDQVWIRFEGETLTYDDVNLRKDW